MITISGVFTLFNRNRARRFARAKSDLELFGPDRSTMIYAGPRQSGKTIAIVEWIKAGRTADGGNDRVMVVRDLNMRDVLVGFGLHRSEIVSYRQLRNGQPRASQDGRQYAVDEAADILATMLNIPHVDLISICTTEEVDE